MKRLILIFVWKKKKRTDTFREGYPSLYFFWSQPRLTGLITRHRLTRFRDWLGSSRFRYVQLKITSSLYMKIICDPRREELNEGDDHPSFNSSLRGSYIWFSYILNFIIILSQVYNEPVKRPAPSWLVSLIGRALHLYRRFKGFESHTNLIFFRLSFCNCKRWVYNCDDHPSFNKNKFVIRDPC